MKEIEAKMYRQKALAAKLEKIEDTKVTVSRDVVLIETRGQRQAVPSMIAFTKLLHEYENLRNRHNKSAKEINVLRESVKALIKTINQMDEELKKKIDRPE